MFIDFLTGFSFELIQGLLIPVGCFYYTWWSINKLYQKKYSIIKKIGLILCFPIFSLVIIGLDYYLNWEETFWLSWLISLTFSLLVLTRKETRGKSVSEIFKLK